jgi:hypothetical protein
VSGGQPWPETVEELIEAQRELDRVDPPPWRPADLGGLHVAAAWVCFARGLTGTGSAGDPAWAAAVTMTGGRLTARTVGYDRRPPATSRAFSRCESGRCCPRWWPA